MDVIVDLTVRDKDGSILHETKDNLLQTETELAPEPAYKIENLNLRLRMLLPRKEDSI